MLIGDVRVADPVNVWFGAVLRGDESHITIEEVVAAVPIGDSADVELAVATAKRAFPEWAATDAEAWAHTLAKAASLIEERAAELAAILTSEQGKSIAEARGEVTHLAHGVRCYAEAATKVRGAYQELPSAFGPAYGQVIRRPASAHALQLSPHPAGNQGRAAARERQHGRGKASRHHAAGHAPGGEHLRRSGRAGRRDGSRCRHRRRPGRPS